MLVHACNASYSGEIPVTKVGGLLIPLCSTASGFGNAGNKTSKVSWNLHFSRTDNKQMNVSETFGNDKYPNKNKIEGRE